MTKNKAAESRSKWRQKLPKQKKKGTAGGQAQQYASLTVPKVSQSKLKDLAWNLDIQERINSGEGYTQITKMQKSNANAKLKFKKNMNEQIFFLSFFFFFFFFSSSQILHFAFSLAFNYHAYSKESQNFVPIKEVRDGVAILNDGSFRALVMASSVNFALKSSDEQNSILFNFQNFLNSLDFDLQIFVQSKKLDIRPYMALLEEQYKNQTPSWWRYRCRNI